MGYLGWSLHPDLTRTTALQAKDLIWLAALGTGLRHPFDLQELSESIDDTAGRLWTPVLDVLSGCLEEMLRSQNLACQDGRFSTSPRGREMLGLLMTLPAGQPGCPLEQVALRMKLAFLDLMPEDDRQAYLGPIISACRNELEECQRRCALCRSQGPFGLHWLRHEADKLRRELQLLLSLQDQAAVSITGSIA